MKTANTKIVDQAVLSQTTTDFKNSVLIVSVLANMFVLTSWLVIQVS